MTQTTHLEDEIAVSDYPYELDPMFGQVDSVCPSCESPKMLVSKESGREILECLSCGYTEST